MTALPSEVFAGMWVAALAHAEYCDVLAHECRVELSARFEPSEHLQSEFAYDRAALVGVLGWAVPLRRSSELARPAWSVVQWPSRGRGVVGCWGLN